MPAALALMVSIQTGENVRWGIGRRPSAGVAAWQPGHAMIGPTVAGPSQQGHASPSTCAARGDAKTAAGRTIQASAAKRTKAGKMRE